MRSSDAVARRWNAIASCEFTPRLRWKGRPEFIALTKQNGTNFMIIRAILTTAIIASVSSMALAQQSGTAEQRAACAPDVRRFCHKLKESDGSDAFLQCFELHRDDLSKRCSDMLKEYGR